VAGGILYRVPITSNAMGAPASAVTVNAGHQPWPTPVAEFSAITARAHAWSQAAAPAALALPALPPAPNTFSSA